MLEIIEKGPRFLVYKEGKKHIFKFLKDAEAFLELNSKTDHLGNSSAEINKEEEQLELLAQDNDEENSWKNESLN